MKNINKSFFKLLLGIFLLTSCESDNLPTVTVLDKNKGFDTPVYEKTVLP